MHPTTVIPIHDEHACAGRRPLRRQPLQLHGDPRSLQPLIDAMTGAVCAPGGPIDTHEPAEAWLRAVRLQPGEVEVSLAAELGCRGELAAQLVFDTLRSRLHDTDIFVRLERETAPG